MKCACQPNCLSKHSRPFQILIYITSCLPLPWICIISTFDWWAILETIAASCAGFLTSAFSVLLSFVSSASHYFVWIIAEAFILFLSQNVFSLGQYSYCLFSYHQVILFFYVLKIVFFFIMAFSIPLNFLIRCILFLFFLFINSPIFQNR